MRKILYIFILTIMLNLLSACYLSSVSTYHNSYKNNFSSIPSNSSILVCPLNEIYTTYSGGGSIVTKELVRQLRGAGMQAEYLSVDEYLPLWNKILKTNGGITSTDGSLSLSKTNIALKEMGKRISSIYSHSYIVVPAFSVKEVKLKMGIAEWDGVKRDVTSRNTRGFQPRISNANTTKTTYSLHGHVSGLSIELYGFDGHGDWIFTTYGGLFVPDMFYNNGALSSKVKENMFSDRDAIAQGVEISIKPVISNRL